MKRGLIMKVEVDDICLSKGTVLKDIYEIKERISKGKLSITYVAYDLIKECKCIVKEYFPEGLALRDMDGKSVVCKMPSLKERFYNLEDVLFNEGEILKGFKHKNISKYINHFTENSTTYVVLEHYDGKTLDEYLKENKDISINDFFNKIFIPLINAISCIHKKNIIHRDIKPSNIIINEQGEPIIIDFGSAINYKICKKKNIFITPGFSPLEFYSEKSRQGKYSDIYSLTATLYYCLCGKVPMDAGKRIIEDNIENIKKYNSEISLFFSIIIMKNLSVNHKKRFLSLKLIKIFVYIECIILKVKHCAVENKKRLLEIRKIIFAKK